MHPDIGSISELTEDPKVALKSKPRSAAVVVFYASWCDDCKVSEEYEIKLSEEFKGQVDFFRLDAVDFEGIADQYAIEKYPTYIFFKNAKPMYGALVEPVAEGEIRNWIEQHLHDNRNRVLRPKKKFSDVF